MANTVATKTCTIGTILQELPEQYREAVESQLATKFAAGGESDYDMFIKLRLAGFRTSPSTISRHRNHKCACVINQEN